MAIKASKEELRDSLRTEVNNSTSHDIQMTLNCCGPLMCLVLSKTVSSTL